MFSNVTSSVTNWFGGVANTLKKDAPEEKVPTPPGETVKEEKAGDQESPTSQVSIKGSVEEKNDDASTPTEGADSPVSSAPETPTEETGEGGMAAVDLAGASTKAIEGAKSLGNFLFSAASKAGKSVTEAGAKIKKTVEDHSILGDFNKEQDAFIKEKGGKSGGAAVPPWVGYADEETLKEQILALSTDRRNFVRSPPSGVQFQFDYEEMHPVAMATMADDSNLDKMRYELVPKIIKEDVFWRNYFYRVSLICQSSELSSMAHEGDTRTSSPDSSIGCGAPAGDSVEGEDADAEFVSDAYQASSKDMEEVRQGIKSLGMDPKQQEEEWERELQAELQEYEVVNDSTAPDDKEIQNMLLDHEDLK